MIANCEQLTNEDHIRSMIGDELALFLSEISYRGKTPSSDPFYEKNCKHCPTTECFMDGRTEPMQLHECDFVDGECPHGDEIMWWLQQPSEVQK